MREIQQEIVPIVEDDLFIILNRPDTGFDYPLHCHQEYEINLVTRTSGTRLVGDTSECFSDFDLVMTGPYLPHKWSSEVHGDQVTIQFSEEFAHYSITAKRAFSTIRQMLDDSKQGLCFAACENAAMIRDRIVNLTQLSGFAAVMSFLELLHLMSISNGRKIADNLYAYDNIVSASKSRRIAKVSEWVANNIQERIRLKDAADLVNMSESAFSHFFKKRTNLSFIEYVNNLRIAKACQLLESTNMTVQEICYDCGFNNKSNFIRVFSARKHMSPSEYRVYISQMILKY